MYEKNYKALVVEESSPGTFVKKVQGRTIDDLPPGELLIRVHYSSLNYKDALSASGNRGVTKKYPHVPGIDAAGVIVESGSADFRPGEEVLATGYDLGMNTPGGYGQYIRIPAEWAVPRPQQLSLRQSMIYGTAGFTAALSVDRLTGFTIPTGQGQILVTGATGGVGSIAIKILTKLGYRVVAVSGKPEKEDFLRQLGADETISRQDAADTSAKLLLREKWAGVIDTVGGEILATAVKSTSYGGAVTCCGNVASPELPLSVYPFILRGVSLLGIDSAKCPVHTRRRIWQKLADEWRIEYPASHVKECSLPELPGIIDTMLQGRLSGRVIVNLL